MSILVLMIMGIQTSNILWFIAGIALTMLAFLIYKIASRKGSGTDANEINEASWTKMLQLMEAERERISSDLHDELGTLISTLYLDVELLSIDNSISPEAEKRLLEIKGRLNLSADAIRKIVWNLMPDTLEHESLAFALRELCHKLDGVKGTH